MGQGAGRGGRTVFGHLVSKKFAITVIANESGTRTALPVHEYRGIFVHHTNIYR